MLSPLPPPDERSPIAADFLARWQAQLLLLQRKRGLQGAEGIRSDLELAPHQARTFLEVLSAPRVRHVLADEVGMGKTIEALMVYAALRAEHPRLWTMILVPGHLGYQWLGEIYLRAHRVFAIATTKREEALDEAQDLLLDREWIASSEDGRRKLLEGFGGRAQAARPRLLVVDEAHRLEPEAYALVQELARKVEHVLLLTATPVELGSERTTDQLRYEQLLRLLDPDLTDHGFEELRRREAQVQKELTEEAEPRAKEGPRAEDAKDLLAASGLAAWRVLRHRRADAPKIFRKRVFEKHVVPAPPGYLEVVAKGRKITEGDALFEWRASISVEQALQHLSENIPSSPNGGAPAAWFEPISLLTPLAQQPDPKLAKLVELIAKAWREDRQGGKKTLRKFLVFVSHRTTLERVARVLEEELATDVAVFHEGLDNNLRPDGEPPPRLQQLLDFRNKPATAILVCEDLAAEGHNLHSTCHTVVLYDLPRNPNTTEQRIGRVDRLGQSRDVVVHVLLLQGTEGVAQAERQAKLGVFEHSLGALAPSEEEELAKGRTLGARRDLTSPLRALRNRRSDALDERVRAAVEAPEGWVFRASTRFQDWYGEPSLAQHCLGSLLTRGIARSFDLKAEKNENPPPRVRESLRFRLARGDAAIPGYRDTWGTCDRDEALEQDHLQFFASGHPFVEDVLARAAAPEHGARQALRFRLKGRGPRFGVLLHFAWDPAEGLESPFARRLARVVLPALSVPVVVSSTPDRRLDLEVGPPAEGSLLRALLEALAQLDPTSCESLLADPFEPELAEPWLVKAREAALARVASRLASFPDTLGRRTLARARSEVERDGSLAGREDYLGDVEAVGSLVRERLAGALLLDAAATFEVR